MKTFILLGGLLFVGVFADAQTKHIIQRGETLELIANRYGVTAKLIKDANPLVDEYYTGLTLSIPPKPKPVVSSTPTRTEGRVSDERKARKTTYVVRSNTHSTGVWGGSANSYLPTYNPYLNNSQVMWQLQHNQLQAAANAFNNQMMQQAQQSWNNYQVNYSNLWNSIPNIDYSAMPMPVLDGASTSIETGVGTSGSNAHSTRAPKTCGACGGKGWIPETKGVASFGLDKWCNECNKNVGSNHYHATCPSCNGKGVW